jgi:aspartyl/asparaginyl beta-hydroxylase (cupin superfamily)
MDVMNYATRSPLPAAEAERAVPPLPQLLRIGKKLRHHIGAVIARSSKVGDAPVYDSASFPWIARLETRWPEIRAEVVALLAREEGIPPLAEISPDHRRIAPPGKWRSFFLWGYGYRNEGNIARCPKTAAAVAAIPASTAPSSRSSRPTRTSRATAESPRRS